MKRIGTIIPCCANGDRSRRFPGENNVAHLPTVTGAPSSALMSTLLAAKAQKLAFERNYGEGRDMTVTLPVLREAEARLRLLEADLTPAGEVAEAWVLEMTDLMPSCANLTDAGRRIARYIEYLSKLPALCFTQKTLIHVLRASRGERGTFLMAYPEIEAILLASIQPQRDHAAGLRAVISAGRRNRHNDPLAISNDHPTPESAARTVADLEQMPASEMRARVVRVYHGILEDKAQHLVAEYGPRLRRLLAAAPVSTVVEQLRALDAQTAPEDQAKARSAYLFRQQIDAAYTAARSEGGTTNAE